MKQQDKKEWTKPILTALTRSNPEEHVLCGCKNESKNSFGPGHSTWHYCQSYHPAGDYCASIGKS